MRLEIDGHEHGFGGLFRAGGRWLGILRISTLAHYAGARRLPGAALKFPVQGHSSLNLHLSTPGIEGGGWGDVLALPLRNWLPDPTNAQPTTPAGEAHKQQAIALQERFGRAAKMVSPSEALSVRAVPLDRPARLAPDGELAPTGTPAPQALQLDLDPSWAAAVVAQLEHHAQLQHAVAAAFPQPSSAPPTQRQLGTVSVADAPSEAAAPRRIGTLWQTSWFLCSQFGDSRLQFRHEMPGVP